MMTEREAIQWPLPFTSLTSCLYCEASLASLSQSQMSSTFLLGEIRFPNVHIQSTLI